MAKFNEIQKHRRAALAELKRARHGDPVTNKLKQKDNPKYPLHSVSGKRKRKLFKKWRREQKEALGKGLVTMQDVEMAVADGATGTSTSTSKDGTKQQMKFHMKKTPKLKTKHSKKRDIKKRKKSSGRVVEASSSADAMVE